MDIGLRRQPAILLSVGHDPGFHRPTTLANAAPWIPLLGINTLFPFHVASFWCNADLQTPGQEGTFTKRATCTRYTTLSPVTSHQVTGFAPGVQDP
jgi:hypothetical protein